MRKQKEAFLKAVWERVRGTGCHAMDAVLEIAEKENIEVEAAAKLIKGDVELMKLVKQEAIDMRQIKATEAA